MKDYDLNQEEIKNYIKELYKQNPEFFEAISKL